MMKNNARGITLIALVITVVVMLILAGVTINLTLGENGIFTTAQKAAKNYTDAQNQEIAGIENFTQTMDKTIQDVTENWDTLASKAKPGDYVEYDGGNGYTGLWQVLYNDNTYGLQIISSKVVVGEFMLGGTTDEEARESYNDAINILNRECRKYVNTAFAISGRCVGSNPLSPDDKITDTVTLEFEYNDTTDSGMKIQDKNYEKDYDQMAKATSQSEDGIRKSNGGYWLASRYVNSTVATFNVRMVDYSGTANSYGLWNVKPEEVTEAKSVPYGLRPVITLAPSVQTNEGDGSVENAFKLVAK